MKDLFYEGCESGIVSHLIYHWECLAFARAYLDDICFFIDEYREMHGCLPFAKEDFSPTLLAYRGFILAAQKVAHDGGYDD